MGLLNVMIIFILSLCVCYAEDVKPVLIIHGGAGDFTRAQLEPYEDRYRAQMQEVLRQSYAVLEEGGSSLDAVTMAITLMEDSGVFNAGRGAIVNANGVVQMDASIMNGRDQQAGAVAVISKVKNPIQVARLVMEETPHVLLAGAGAEGFAQQQNIKIMPADYFIHMKRHRQQQKIQESKHGTVGAVALDTHGNLAAGTSTGGTDKKLAGRIGDSPLIGAGTYADNASCAVSCTGEGEYFIRLSLAKEIAALVEHKDRSVETAAKTMIHEKLTELKGSGGVIVLDTKGRVSIEYNTNGMMSGVMQNSKATNIIFFKKDSE